MRPPTAQLVPGRVDRARLDSSTSRCSPRRADPRRGRHHVRLAAVAAGAYGRSGSHGAPAGSDSRRSVHFADRGPVRRRRGCHGAALLGRNRLDRRIVCPPCGSKRIGYSNHDAHRRPSAPRVECEWGEGQRRGVAARARTRAADHGPHRGQAWQLPLCRRGRQPAVHGGPARPGARALPRDGPRRVLAPVGSGRPVGGRRRARGEPDCG